MPQKLRLSLVGALLTAGAVIPWAHGETTLTGVYQRIATDTVGGAHARGTRDLLVVGSHAYPLRLRGARTFAPGQRLRIAGRLAAGVISADTATSLATTLPLLTQPVTRLRVLVILATWTQPDAVTPARAAAQLFVDNDAWTSEVSYGRRGLTGVVTPWLTIAGPVGGLCYTNHREVMLQAKAAALLAGHNSAGYDRTMLYFPRSTNTDCGGYAGWAYQPGTEVWLNGFMDRAISVHELGHTDGLWHAATLQCTVGGKPVSLAATGCTVDEYGDVTDAMGASLYAGHYSAVQKERLGWLAGRTVTLSPGRNAVLAPYEGTSPGPLAAVVAGAGRTRYWLEYRTAVGADSALPTGSTGRLLVHLDDPARSPMPLLLDLTPDGDFNNAGLAPGSRWVAPEQFIITVGMPTSAGVPVTVSVPAKRALRRWR